ncbi:MAG: hypothetical protein U0800_27785 [Isosphaeraceae bacterium]
MQISTEELIKATEALLVHLRAGGREALEIPHDFYWFVPTDQRYDAYKEPAGLTVGQLSDDWAELRKLAIGEAEPVNYAFVWLASILRALGETVPG